MNQEEARAGKNYQRKGMQMGKVKHLWWKEICLQEGMEKAIARGSRAVAAAVALLPALSRGERFGGTRKETPG